jgi:hypothetical protein
MDSWAHKSVVRDLYILLHLLNELSISISGSSINPTSYMGRYLKQVLEQHPPEVLAG